MPVALPPALLVSALLLQLAGSPLAPRPESALPPELMPLLRALKRHGFRVRIALPPARQAYGQYEPASRTLWLSPLTFELGIARQTFLHEAVHAAQSCPDGRVLRPIGWTLPLQPVVRNEISGMLVNAWFLWTWRALPPRLPHLALGPRLALMTAASLAAWAAGAAAWTWLLAGPLAGVPAPARAALGLALLAAAGLIATNTPAPAPRGRRAVGPVALAGRGVLAAAAIALAVALGSSGFPLLAGMASVFPAIFLTTMVSLWLAQGEAVPLGAVGPMILGSSAVALYATFALFSFPALGPGLGAAAAWTGAVMVGSWPAATRLRRRSKP